MDWTETWLPFNHGKSQVIEFAEAWLSLQDIQKRRDFSILDIPMLWGRGR